MSDRPAWSVVIPAWEASATIGACLRSLADQVDAPSFEVIVVDSSAGDATRGAVAKFAEELRGLEYRHLEERAFPGKARNAGAQAARGDWLLFLDADIVAANDLLASADRALRELPAVVGGAIGLSGAPGVSARLRHLFEFKESLPGVPARRTWQLPTACFAIARERFLATGGFPDVRASEDWLFNWALWSAGEAMRFDPRLHVNHATADGWRDFARYARVLGHASGAARRAGGLPGQWLVRHPSLAWLLPPGRTARAVVWCARYSRQDLRLLLWSWPAYFILAGIWAREFRRGVLGLPPPRPER